MPIKKNNYIEEDLAWLEGKANDIKEYIDNLSYNDITDRTISLSGPRGSFEKVVAPIEAQQKAYRESLREYALIIEVINKLRQQEETKKQVRGKEDLSPTEAGLLDE